MIKRLLAWLRREKSTSAAAGQVVDHPAARAPVAPAHARQLRRYTTRCIPGEIRHGFAGCNKGEGLEKRKAGRVTK